MTLDYFYGQSGELFSYFRIPKALFQDKMCIRDRNGLALSGRFASSSPKGRAFAKR